MFLHQGQTLLWLCLHTVVQCLLREDWSNRYQKLPTGPKKEPIIVFTLTMVSGILVDSWSLSILSLQKNWFTLSSDVSSEWPLHVIMIRVLLFTWFLGLKLHVRVTSSPLATSTEAWLIVTSSPKVVDITMRQKRELCEYHTMSQIIKTF